jgi:hypothetical protein
MTKKISAAVLLLILYSNELAARKFIKLPNFFIQKTEIFPSNIFKSLTV